MKITNVIELLERYDKALRLILDVAQHEITKFHESGTYDICEKVVDDAEKILPELKARLNDNSLPQRLDKGSLVCLTDESLQLIKQSFGVNAANYRQQMILEVVEQRFSTSSEEWHAIVRDIAEDDTQEFAVSRLRPATAQDMRSRIYDCERKVVLFPIDRFERNASNEEIIADFDSHEDHDIEVQVLTPDELAAKLNDDDAGFSEQWVRFINI